MQEKIFYEEGLPIHVEVLNVQEYPWHRHNDIQILYVLEGEVELKMIFARYRLCKDNMHFIHSADVHGLTGITQNNLVVVLSLSKEYFSEAFPHLETQIFSIKCTEDVINYKRQLSLKAHIFSIISELYGQEKDYKTKIKNISMSLIKALYKDFRSFAISHEDKTFEHTASHDSFQIDRISRIVSHVYENYPYKLSLSSLAESENINTYYLSHLFQKYTKESFRNFVSMVRVEMSEAQLLSTNNSISQISQNVGFSNAKYYIDNFKDWFGCHPKEYRQLYSHRILGKAPIRATKLPLESINHALKSDMELPIISEGSPNIKTLSIDFNRPPIGLLGSNCFFIPSDWSGCLRPTGLAAHRIRQLYQDTCPNEDAIAFLQKLFQDIDGSVPQISLMDSSGEQWGIYAINGLKKPLYYALQFLGSLWGDVADVSSQYVITRKGLCCKILLCNQSSCDSNDYEVHFSTKKGSYKVTSHVIDPNHSFAHYWNQLQFMPDLSEADIRSIDRMSCPQVSFSIIPQSPTGTCKFTLNPLEIVLIECTPL